MFRKMCGEEALRNVFFVTTMWDHVNPKLAVGREKELATRDEFFKPMLQCGAKMYRHDKTAASAQDIVSRLVLGIKDHMTLQLQRELVDDHLCIADTAAGKELLVEYEVLVKKQQAELHEVKQQLSEMQKKNDRQSLRELIAERQDLVAQIHKVERECQRLVEEYAAKQQQINEKVAEAAKALQLEKEARIITDRRLDELIESLKVPCSDGENVPIGTQETRIPKLKKLQWGVGIITLLRVIDVALNILEMATGGH
jgi:myosin heavy subunit